MHREIIPDQPCEIFDAVQCSISKCTKSSMVYEKEETAIADYTNTWLVHTPTLNWISVDVDLL